MGNCIGKFSGPGSVPMQPDALPPPAFAPAPILEPGILNNFPKDLTEKIAGFVTPRDRKAMRLVDKDFRNATTSQVTSLKLSRTEARVSNHHLQKMMQDFSNVRHIDLRHSSQNIDAHLAVLKNLKFSPNPQMLDLVVNGDCVTGVGMGHLRGVSKLKKLTIVKPSQEQLPFLRDLAQVQSIELDNCEDITDAGLSHLQGLSQLKLLNLSQCSSITDAGLAHLKDLTQLQDLNLSMCRNITDAGLAHLQNLTQLQSLNLAVCMNTTDTGLAHLQNLMQLRGLNLIACDKITDAGLAHLEGLVQLRIVSIIGCTQFTYGGIAKLRRSEKLLHTLKVIE